jgi:superfamily II DNA/RNA helicase
VKRILDRTPAGSQRLLFSATLDNAIDVLVKRYLRQPVVHEADSAQSPVTAMDHHVLHVRREDRVAVIVDLTSAPGRTVVFTRTKHGAKALAKQLNRSGVPSVELHGNLSQGARTRNMDAFHAGRATTLVATDIAARGIHVDDVSLVVHADPPVEHKAYLHRSGRTARAGASGTVVTLMTDEQVRDVRALTRAAGIKPTLTKLGGATHPILAELAPGERALVPGGLTVAPVAAPAGSGSGSGRSRSGAGTTGDGSRPAGSGRRRGGRGRSRSGAATGTTGNGGNGSRGGGNGGSGAPAGSGSGSGSGSAGRRTGSSSGSRSGGRSGGGGRPSSKASSTPSSSRHSAAGFSSGRR